MQRRILQRVAIIFLCMQAELLSRWCYWRVSGSSLAAPPQSAIIVAFEDTYDLSLLANTLSEQGIDSSLIVEKDENRIYEHFIEVEILRLDVDSTSSPTTAATGPENSDVRALDICRSLFRDKQLAKRVDEIRPTFVIFPALRHDGCLLPWSKAINSIPIIWARGTNQELYAFDQTKVALPVSNSGLFSTLLLNLNLRMTSNSARNNYIKPALKLFAEHFPEVDVDLDNLYSSVKIVLWGADSIMRTSAAALSPLLVQVGCHHCRGAQPVASALQKQLADFKSGVILVLLDRHYSAMIKELSLLEQQRQGREEGGHAVLWRIKDVPQYVQEKPDNLFIHEDADRQDLIGFPKTAIVLSHCPDTEFLESAFHGKSMLCFPRNLEETKNSLRGAELGISISMQGTELSGSGGGAVAVANAVSQVERGSEYRENGRRVSMALRDRLEPAVDRLVHWLKYAARTRSDEGPSLLAPPTSSIATFAEAFQWIFGFFVGTLFSIFLALTWFFVSYIIDKDKLIIKSKGRYQR